MGRSNLPVWGATVLLGVVAAALLVKHTMLPLDAARLRLVHSKSQARHGRSGSKGNVAAAAARAGGYEEVMVASRAALRSEEQQYTVKAVMRQLFRPRPRFAFHREGLVSLNATDGGEEHLEGWDGVDAHLWSEEQPEEDNEEVEIVDILTYKLPLMLTAIGIIVFVELTAVMQRRGRDLALALANGRPLDPKVRVQIAKESQWMSLRPLATGVGIFMMYLVVKEAIDVFDKCFWNWECWADLDCNLRILTPAVAECTIDVAVPAALVAAILAVLLLGALWSCTRAGAAAFLLALGVSGLLAVTLMSEYVLLLWLLAAMGGAIFWFAVLPTLDPATVPSWAEDLGSLSASTDPATGELRDGDAAQPRPDPLDDRLRPSERAWGCLGWGEAALAWWADFCAQHFRYVRVCWNGVVVRLFFWVTFGRRARVHGEEHVAHLASGDAVLLAAGGGGGGLGLWVATAVGLWPASGASFFTLFPCASSDFYTDPLGALSNLLLGGMSHYPMRLQTGSAWNEYALGRMCFELGQPGAVVGVDPAGAWGGELGALALGAPGAHVVPCHVEGLGGGFWEEVWKCLQWNAGGEHPIHVSFGPPCPLSRVREAHGETRSDAEVASAAELVVEGVRKAKQHCHRQRFGDEGGLYQGAVDV